MPDMLVKLKDIDIDRALEDGLKASGIVIKRAMPPDIARVTDFAEKHFSEGWAHECLAGVMKGGVWLAVKEREIIGFACYNATRPDYFGPTGVRQDMRKLGIGRALLLRSLYSLREIGYAYAIIGWAGPVDFYKKTVGAIPIEGPDGESYWDMIGVDAR